MTTRVWYHSNCYDGFGAAWAASLALGREGVVYAPCSYGFDPPEYNPGDKIYIVDFSFPRETLETIFHTVCTDPGGVLQVIDHHKTAQEALANLAYAEFDMERSGAGMTWDFFHKGKPRPKLINHIEDRDLWKFNLSGSKSVHAYLCGQPFDFDVWDEISETMENSEANIYVGGELLLAAKMMEVQKTCKSSWCSYLDGHKVAVVNTSAHWSEVGHKLLEDNPSAEFAMSFTQFEDKVMWSLRGRGDFDVSAIAKRRGGGGHKSAAGFKTHNFAGILQGVAS